MVDLKNIILALLLSNDKKMVSFKDIQSILPEFTETQILKAINEINEDQNQVCMISQASNMYYIKVKSIFNHYLSRMHCGAQNAAFSKALLETISVIAMYQPITKSQAEDKIGKKISDEIFFQLQDLQWIRVHVTKSSNLEYLATTKEFLQYFNISSVIELEDKLNSILLDSNLQVVW